MYTSRASVYVLNWEGRKEERREEGRKEEGRKEKQADLKQTRKDDDNEI